ncbi:MAG: hypothetical protein OXH70_11740 [Acidobacteria bacterium]|nr:hypothetical protein [Acidobacteriota bacterium]
MNATTFGVLAPLVLISAVAGPPHRLARQAADSVEFTVGLTSAVTCDGMPAGDVELEFIEAVTGEPVVLYILESPSGEQTFQVTVPLFDSRSGWFASARSPGLWSPTVYLAPAERAVSLTLVPEGLLRVVPDLGGMDGGEDRLETGDAIKPVPDRVAGHEE